LTTKYTDLQHSEHPTSVRRPRHVADHSFQSSAQVRMRGSSPHVFMVRCLMNELAH